VFLIRDPTHERKVQADEYATSRLCIAGSLFSAGLEGLLWNFAKGVFRFACFFRRWVEASASMVRRTFKTVEVWGKKATPTGKIASQ